MNYANRRTPAFGMTLAFAIMMLAVSLAFYCATDPRPQAGTAACERQQAEPVTAWSLEKDGPLGCKQSPYARLLAALSV